MLWRQRMGALFPERATNLHEEIQPGCEGKNMSESSLSVGLNEDDSLDTRERRRVAVRNYLIGCVLCVLTGVLVSINSMAIKMNPDIPVSQFLLLQGFFLVPFQACFMIKGKHYKTAVAQIQANLLGVLIKIVSISTVVPILLSLLAHMPLGDLTTIISCMPCLSVSLFAWLLFGERLSKVQLSLVALSLVGVLLIIRPDFLFGIRDENSHYPNRIAASCISLVLPIIITAQILAVRKIGFGVEVSTLNVLIGFGLVISGLIYSFCVPNQALITPAFCLHPIMNSAIVVTASMVATLIQPCEIASQRRIKAGIFAAVSTSKVVLDYVLQLIFFPADSLHYLTVIGVTTITFTVIVLCLQLDQKISKFLRANFCGSGKGAEDKDSEDSKANPPNAINIEKVNEQSMC